MKASIFFLFLLTALSNVAMSQYTLSGKVLNRKTLAPIGFASVSLPNNELWAVADTKGEFTIKNVPAGKATVTVQYTGFVTQQYEIQVNGDTSGLRFTLTELNLTLEDVMVTAKTNMGLTTSYSMDRTVLDHMQLLSVTDVTSLLPGGKTSTVLHLAGDPQRFAVNGNSGEMGNPLFGVAVEVNGIRLSNNAQTGATGIDARNISSSNVESIEIITGIPSVEYGDLTNGMVKINTRKGVSPFILEMVTKPNTKQVALSKGIKLGPESGVLNMNIEHTRSISDLASPNTAYARNGLSLDYINTFNKRNRQPLTLTLGLSGNLGGFSTMPDPDRFTGTYNKMKDNAIRSNLSVKWLINKKWLTNIEAGGTFNYSNRLSETRANISSATSVAAIHAMEEGYHVGETYATNPSADIILVEPGYFFRSAYDDSKAVNYSGFMKANWTHRYGAVTNSLLAGASYDGSVNQGKGEYYDNMRYAPTWRPYAYSDVPAINNYAVYIEDKIIIPAGISGIQLIGGVRSDITAISGSEYGTVSSWSPRVNAKYTFWEDNRKKVRNLSVKIGWGKSVKLPSFNVLYRQPTYRDILTFAPGTTSEGQTFYAYYTNVSQPRYNPDLQWQYVTQNEITLTANIEGTRIAVTAAQDKTYQSYSSINGYTPFTYKLTDQAALENFSIPYENRIYTVDQKTGVVTVTDKTGALPAETLTYKEYTRALSNTMPSNGSPAIRRRLSWTIDFKQIAAIKTNIRVDGNYYYYKGVEQTMRATVPNVVMADGNPYKYVGFFVGGASSANGSVSKTLNMNVTATTHIPALRLIISARIEGSLMDYSRNLSEYANGQQRGFVLDNKNDYVASIKEKNIYGGDRFVGLYPEYYSSLDDINTLIPFADKFLWAKENDPALYNELAKLVVKSNYNYYFNKSSLSTYYSANISITKEIGNLASVSFNAINFINNMALIRSSQSDTDFTLFESSYIPKFYYGLSLRLKM